MRLLRTLVLFFVAEAAAEPVMLRDIPYRQPEEHPTAEQALDLHLPADAVAAPRPLMVYIHGGGWKLGDKSRVGRKAGYFTARGWAFASVNYRLLPAGRHPANVDDVAAAIAWLHNHAAEYALDRDRIAVMGHSAGAHLAALVATNPGPLRRAGKPLTVIKAVIPVDTLAYDLPSRIAASPDAGILAAFGTDPESLRDASPQRHVAKGAGIPPFLICYSAGSARVDSPERRSAAAEGFATALRRAEVSAEVVDALDRGHREINERLGDPADDRVTGRIAAFLDAVIGRSAGAAGSPALPGSSGSADPAPK